MRQRFRLNPVQLLIVAIALLLTACENQTSSSEYAAQAETFLADTDLIAATLAYKNALAQDPENPESRLALGQIYLQLGMGKAAEHEFVRASGHPRSDAAALTALQARAVVMQGRFDEARALLETTDIAAAERQVVIGLSYLGEREFDQATAAFLEALEHETGNLPAIRGLGWTYIQSGQLESARDLVGETLKEHPDDAELTLIQAEVTGRFQDIEGALSSYQSILTEMQVADESLTGTAAIIGAASSLITLDRSDEAGPYVKRLARARPDHPLVKLLRGEMAYRAKDYAAAQEYLRDILKNFPKHSRTLKLLGAVKYAQGDFEQAQYYLQQHLALEPDVNPKTRVLLGTILLRHGDPKQAIEVLLPLAGTTAADRDFYMMLGRSFLLVGKLAEGGKWLEKAAELGGSNAYQAQTDRALIALVRGDSEQAIVQLKDISEEEPDNGAHTADRYLIYAYVVAGDLENALLVAEKFQNDEPDEAITHYLVGDVLMRMGRFETALAAFDRALKIQPNMEAASIALGRIALRTDEIERAREIYEDVLARHPSHVGALRALAEVASVQGDTASAISYLEKIRELNRNDTPSRIALAHYYLSRTDFDLAFDRALEAFSLEPSNPLAMQVLVKAGVESGNEHDAENAIARFIAVGSQSEKSTLAVVRAKMEMGQHNEARALVDEYSKTPAQAHIADLIRGAIALEGGDYEAAKSFALKAAAAEPGFSEAFALLFQASLFSGDSAGAVAAAEQFAALSPDNLNAQFLRAFAYEKAGKPGQAQAEYKRIVEQNPNNVAAIMNLARHEEDSGRLESAKLYYESVLSIDPQNSEAAVATARIESHEGRDIGDSIPELEQVRAENTNDPWIRVALIERYLQQQDAAAALPVAEELIELRPLNPRVLELVAITNALAGKMDDALRIATSWVKRDEDNPKAYETLAGLQLQLGEQESAVRSLRKSVELDDGNQSAKFTLAGILLAEGNYDEVVTFADEILADDVDNLQARLLRASANWEIGATDAALTDFRRLYEIQGSALAATKLARALWATGKTDESQALLRNELKDKPDNAELLLALGDTQFAAESFDEAITTYETLDAKGFGTGVVLNRLAWLYDLQSNEKALPTARRAYELAPQDANVLDTLGWLLVKRSNTEQGLSFLERALEIAETKLPESEQMTIRFHAGSTYARAGRKSEAIKVLEAVSASTVEFPERENALALYRSLR